MFEKMRHYCSIILYTYKINLLEALEYTTWLVPLIFGEMLYDIGLFYMINVLVTRFQPFSGWGQYEIAFLFSFGLISEAITVIFFYSSFQVSNFIIKGEFDKFLIKPLGIYRQFAFKELNIVGIAEIFSSAIIFIYSLSKLQINLDVGCILKMIIFTICAILLRYSLFTILNSISFWTKKSTSLHNICCQITNEVTRYPITIFPKILQSFLTFVFPIAFITYYPSINILEKNSAGIASSITFLVIISVIFFILSIKIFHKGLKKYESAGS